MQEIVHLVPYKRIIFFFIIIFSLKSFAQNYPDPIVDSLIRKGINNIINQKYNSADSLFNKLDSEFPSLPFGKIYLAALNISRSYSLNENYNDSLITDYLNDAEDKAEILVDENPADIWNIYSKALSEGYYAYYKALKENWLSAISTGFDAIKDFEKCLSINHNFHEAMIAIGSYEYWKSKKADWIPFIEDERNDGINYLKKAIQNSSYNKYLAINSLIWIYIDEKDFTLAQVLAEKTVKEYPESIFFKWDLARVYEETNIPKAIEFYNQILTSYNETSAINIYNSVILNHIIAQLYSKLNENEKALKLCDEILSIKLTEKEKNKLENRLERVKRLKTELSGEK